MDIKNLYVVDAVLPTMMIVKKLEEATILKTRICRKAVVRDINVYIDVDSNMKYSEGQIIGEARKESLRPLSEYYNSSEYNHSNRKEVREKVKTLRKNGKI